MRFSWFSPSWQRFCAGYRVSTRFQRALPLVLALALGTCGSVWLAEGERPARGTAVAAVRVAVPEARPEELSRQAPRVTEVTSVEPLSPAVLDFAEFARAFDADVERAGSMSIGRANRGFLFNAVRLPEGPLWEVVEPRYAWGTRTTVQAITQAIKEVNRLFPETPRLYVGHLSRQHGGWLRPHRSHQSGRDVDLGFYYLDGPHWYKRATPENLDVERTWALLSAMMKLSPIEYAFVDRSLHAVLRAEAERVGEAPGLLAEVFDGSPRAKPILRHARGHDDHIHVRFESRAAIQNAQLAVRKLGWRARNRGVLLGMLKARAREQERARDKSGLAARATGPARHSRNPGG